MSLKTYFAAAVLGVTALPLLSLAEENRPAPGERGPGGPGGGRGRGMNPEALLARLDEAVGLTAEQKTKAIEIYKKQIEALQAVPQEERREKGMEIAKATAAQIRALLTPEQQKKFDAMPQGPGGPGGRGPGGPGGGRPPGDAPKTE